MTEAVSYRSSLESFSGSDRHLCLSTASTASPVLMEMIARVVQQGGMALPAPLSAVAQSCRPAPGDPAHLFSCLFWYLPLSHSLDVDQ